MQFKRGAAVLTSGGEELGTVDRVVLDPRTKDVVALVVRGGSLLSEDKVVPINLVATAVPDRVILRDRAGDLRSLPPFEETFYVPAGDMDAGRNYDTGDLNPVFGYPPLGVTWWDYMVGPYVTEQNIPKNTVALKEGSKVMSSDGRHVGNVERVSIDAQTDRATHLLISRGLLLKERKLVPMAWVSAIEEDEVQLAVGSDLLNRLPTYQEPAGV